MNTFDALMELVSTFHGPKGCPWKKEQTFKSLQPFLLEETHELLEALDYDDKNKIIEELGDLFYLIIFYAKIGEKMNQFTLDEVIQALNEKLIRRHPHVFGDCKTENVQEVIKNWEKMKASEHKEKGRANLLDGIPPTMPSLAKAQKMIEKFIKAKFSFLKKDEKNSSAEEKLTQELISLILTGQNQGIDVESALRRTLIQLEKEFRDSENQHE